MTFEEKKDRKKELDKYKQKKVILDYTIQHSRTPKSGIASIFLSKIKVSISRQAVSLIKKNSKTIDEAYSRGNNKTLKRQTVRFEVLDERLSEWLLNLEEMGAAITDMILITKALKMAEQLNLDNLKASRRWIDKFKQRHGAKLRIISGETFLEKQVNTNDFLKISNEKIKHYGPEKVYNADETGPFSNKSHQKRYVLVLICMFVICYYNIYQGRYLK